ncbi:hypothetical protein ANO11243_047790 [Dothideomycetidae sp. 11243]|nr:hypothetical protein ANO11243_047790 [fungal sp. No.11243]
MSASRSDRTKAMRDAGLLPPPSKPAQIVFSSDDPGSPPRSMAQWRQHYKRLAHEAAKAAENRRRRAAGQAPIYRLYDDMFRRVNDEWWDMDVPGLSETRRNALKVDGLLAKLIANLDELSAVLAHEVLKSVPLDDVLEASKRVKAELAAEYT